MTNEDRRAADYSGKLAWNESLRFDRNGGAFLDGGCGVAWGCDGGTCRGVCSLLAVPNLHR